MWIMDFVLRLSFKCRFNNVDFRTRVNFTHWVTQWLNVFGEKSIGVIFFVSPTQKGLKLQQYNSFHYYLTANKEIIPTVFIIFQPK